MKYLSFLLFGLLTINCNEKIDKDEELKAILIYKVEELSYVNDSLQRELEYTNANLDVCKSYHLEE